MGGKVQASGAVMRDRALTYRSASDVGGPRLTDGLEDSGHPEIYQLDPAGADLAHGLHRGTVQRGED